MAEADLKELCCPPLTPQPWEWDIWCYGINFYLVLDTLCSQHCRTSFPLPSLGLDIRPRPSPHLLALPSIPRYNTSLATTLALHWPCPDGSILGTGCSCVHLHVPSRINAFFPYKGSVLISWSLHYHPGLTTQIMLRAKHIFARTFIMQNSKALGSQYKLKPRRAKRVFCPWPCPLSLHCKVAVRGLRFLPSRHYRGSLRVLWDAGRSFCSKCGRNQALGRRQDLLPSLAPSLPCVSLIICNNISVRTQVICPLRMRICEGKDSLVPGTSGTLIWWSGKQAW
jgi:hypothetical protein